ncbi:HU family DNA-binding protein [Roseinatronobacter monicus]|uniref:Integration host factor subunit beta n=1 Tax=Roseinatronobacter monicus TaxID=393481 RepID=A0A543K4S3_9RHOB|nr:HU family DNA-binding protein [Roseinatronobacter monicus]TQM90080.1 integration host factor subunit beta [Roseinatronobacter monicus]
MVRSELIAQLASHYPDLTHRQITAVVDAVFDEITDALARGNRVEFRGFGVFAPKQRGGRIGRNPKTGESVQVAPKQIAMFRASKALLARLNGET